MNNSSDIDRMQAMGVQMKKSSDDNPIGLDYFEETFRRFSDTYMRARKMIHVMRFSGTPMHRPHNIAEHGMYVALLYLNLAPVCKCEINEKIMNYILLHDILETETGDLLWPAKNISEFTKASWNVIEQEIVAHRAQVLAPFTEYALDDFPKEKALFKDCDHLEALTSVLEEIMMGNKHPELLKIVRVYEKLIEESQYPIVQALYASIKKRIGYEY